MCFDIFGVGVGHIEKCLQIKIKEHKICYKLYFYTYFDRMHPKTEKLKIPILPLRENLFFATYGFRVGFIKNCVRIKIREHKMYYKLYSYTYFDEMHPKGVKCKNSILPRKRESCASSYTIYFIWLSCDGNYKFVNKKIWKDWYVILQFATNFV